MGKPTLRDLIPLDHPFDKRVTVSVPRTTVTIEVLID